MEAFSIACTTCQAKLRVRDASAIGQILTCPKCGSMVLIESPAGNNAPVELALPRNDALVSKPPPLPATRAAGELTSEPAPTTAASKFGQELADTVEDLTRYGTVGTRPESEAELAPEELGEADQLSAEPAAIPGPEWSAIEPQYTRRWLPAGMAGITGALLAVLLIAFIANRGSRPDLTAPQASANNPPLAVQEPAAAELKSNTSPVAENKPQEPASPGPVANTEATAQKPNEEITPAESVSKKPAEEASSQDSAEPATLLESPQEAKPATGPLLTAPPDFAAEATGTEADRIRGAGSLSDTLKKLGGMFDEAPADEATKPAETAADVSSAESPAAEPADDAVRLPRPAARPIDVAARLKDPIAEIEFTNLPLVEFLQFITDFSTIPVTLDADMLKWLGITPATPVSVTARDTTVGKLLDEVLGKVGLTYQAVDQQLFVTRKSTTTEAKRKIKLNVSDLVADDPAQAGELRDHVVTLIAPGTWGGDGDQGTLSVEDGSVHVEHNESVLLSVMELCERLRVARGLSPRSKFDPKHFQLPTRSERFEPQLAKRLTLNYPRPTSFVRIVNRLAKDAGISILIDWRAAADAGWNPDAEVTLTVVDQPLEKSLEALVKPMELAYRIVDETTIEITTPAVLEARQELEIYPVAKLASSVSGLEEPLPRLLQVLPANWFRDSGGPGGIRYDGLSRCLLVNLSQPRHQALQKLLNEKSLVSTAAASVE